MSDYNDNRSFLNSTSTILFAFLLLLLFTGGGFYAGMIYGGEGLTRTVEREVTREVPVEVVVEREVTREVMEEVEVTRVVPDTNETDQPDSDQAQAEARSQNNDPAQDNEPQEPIEPAIDLSPEDLELFFEVWEIVEEDFDGDLPAKEALTYAVIEAGLETLDDDYTRFTEPAVAARAREDMDGSFEGIGAFVRENDDGFIEIVRPMDGRPADLAGLRAGDIIIEINGENVVGQSIDEVINQVRGPRDTVVTLGVEREATEEILQIEITRARIEIPTVESELLENEIAYIKLSNFNAIAYDRLQEATREMLAENPQALILDLRDNPGGFLNTAVDIADLYLPEGVILYERNRNGLDQTFRSVDGEIGEQIPMVVLVNAGSASASELLAGALRDNERAVIVGETSFGKGSVQQIRTLSDGSELRVTIARWYTPDNVNISREGIVPDIEVELPTDADLGGESDLQLQRAINYILDGE